MLSWLVSGVAEHSPASKEQLKAGYEAHVAQTDIPGLVSRVNNPLEFLGLYGTQHGACHRHDIPARVVSSVIVYCVDKQCVS